MACWPPGPDGKQAKQPHKGDLMHGSLRRLTTSVLAAGFIGFGTAALINPLFTTPAIASTPLPVVVSHVTYRDLTPADQHRAAMDMAFRVQRAERRAQHRRWLAYRRHQAALAEAAATATAPSVSASASTSTTYSPPAAAGILSYSALERLWVAEGGSASEESVAACISEHESSGNPNANNGVDLGLYQIDPANFPSQSYDSFFSPSVNTADAVSLSKDGTDWTDWQTAPDCGV
jgi:hypothetical protein